MIILKNATVVQFYPAQVTRGVDVVIDNEFIKAVGKNIAEKYKADKIIDASNKIVAPGIVCAHNHFYSALARGILADIKPSQDFINILKNLWWRLDRALDEESL
ncbi:MAG: chlorohydrolase, partial [Ignavibacteria bacterium]|nr:chlorohydrolase [Ignavibacteria bacterium]